MMRTESICSRAQRRSTVMSGWAACSRLATNTRGVACSTCSRRFWNSQDGTLWQTSLVGEMAMLRGAYRPFRRHLKATAALQMGKREPQYGTDIMPLGHSTLWSHIAIIFIPGTAWVTHTKWSITDPASPIVSALLGWSHALFMTSDVIHCILNVYVCILMFHHLCLHVAQLVHIRPSLGVCSRASLLGDTESCLRVIRALNVSRCCILIPLDYILSLIAMLLFKFLNCSWKEIS